MAAGRWDFALLAGGTEVASGWPVLADLSSATSRRVSLRVDGESSISFSLNGLAPDAVFVEELRSDVVAYRNDAPVLRTRVTGTQDGLGAQGHSVSVTSVDYRTLLGRRLLFAGDPELTAWSTTIPNPAVDQRAIAWGLIARTQARTGGNLGITDGSTATGVLRNRTYEPGSSVGELITNLSRVANGFDWEIDPGLVFRLYYPQRGGDTGYLLDWGGVVTSVNRSVSAGQFTNRLRFNGGQQTDSGGLTIDAPTAEAVSAIGIEGSWETNLADSQVIDQTAANERAAYELAERAQILPSYTVGLNSELWSPDEFWLGDTGRLAIQSGRLDIDTDVRCIGLDFDIDNDGYERVSATLGRLSPAQAFYQRQQEQARQIAELGRH